MRTRPVRRLLAAGLALAAPWAAARCDVEYRFERTPSHFDVTLSFDAGNRRESRVRLAPEWAGITDFHRAVEMLPADGPITIEEETAPGRWRIEHPAHRRVALRYRIRHDVAVDEFAFDHGAFYRNRIDATAFQFFGYAALLQPEHLPDSETLQACIRFRGLGAEDRFATSFGEGQEGGAADQEIRVSPQALRSAVYLGGAFRIERREVAGRPVRVAMRGTWSFTDAQFADETARVIGAHRRFWHDEGTPYYLVSLLPNGKKSGSAGGTGLYQAFAMHASSDFAVPGPSFDHLIAHEHLHGWIPRRIGTMGEGESARYWFSEGFTDYLTHRLLLAAGPWTLDDYAGALNRAIEELALSPARNASNEAVARGFWKDAATQRVPYLRGEQVALLWARRLEARGDTLEALLLRLKLPADHLPKESDQRRDDLAAHRLRAALGSVLGNVAERDFARYVEAGEPLALDEGFLGPCFIGAEAEKARFELGFHPGSLQTRRVTGVVAGSRAEAAGIREGMALGGWSIQYQHPEREVEIMVVEEGARRTFRYIPVAREKLRLVQFAPRPGAAGDAACKRWSEAPFATGTASPRAAAGG